MRRLVSFTKCKSCLGIKFQESLSGKKVLDLGSGRGGGCKYRWSDGSTVAMLARDFGPLECVGVDISSH